MRKILSLLAVLVLYCALAFGQNRAISGQVRDENGSPIPFASVKIKGTNSGTSANSNGEFTLNAKTGDVLVVSAVNFGSKEVKVSSENSVSVGLSKTEEVIDEVIVTA